MTTTTKILIALFLLTGLNAFAIEITSQEIETVIAEQKVTHAVLVAAISTEAVVK